MRLMGKAAFAPLSDGLSRLQIYVRKNDGDEAWTLYQKLDLGDWLGVEGFCSSRRPASFRST